MSMKILISIVNISDHTKCASLSNQKCMIQSTLINLHPIECSLEFHYFSFGVKLDRCVGSCNNRNDFSSNLVKYMLHYMNKWIQSINKSIYHPNVGVDLMEKIFNSDQWWNNNKWWCECEKRHVYEKDYIWNPSTCNCKNGKYLASIMDNSAVTCYEVIKSYDEETKTIPTNFNEKKVICKM